MSDNQPMSDKNDELREVTALMLKYFVLKDQFKRLTVASNKYMGTYECGLMIQDSYDEPAKQCLQRRSLLGVLPKEMCGSCSKRHWFYLERIDNAHQRSSIMRRVRYLALHKSNNLPTKDEGGE